MTTARNLRFTVVDVRLLLILVVVSFVLEQNETSKHANPYDGANDDKNNDSRAHPALAPIVDPVRRRCSVSTACALLLVTTVVIPSVAPTNELYTLLDPAVVVGFTSVPVRVVEWRTITPDPIVS